jgi:hypothetical protein
VSVAVKPEDRSVLVAEREPSTPTDGGTPEAVDLTPRHLACVDTWLRYTNLRRQRNAIALTSRHQNTRDHEYPEGA